MRKVVEGCSLNDNHNLYNNKNLRELDKTLEKLLLTDNENNTNDQET